MYLLYNEVLKNYSFVESPDPYDENRRINLGNLNEKSVIEKLSGIVDFKRKSVLYLGREISVMLAENLVKLFEATKVEIEVEK